MANDASIALGVNTQGMADGLEKAKKKMNESFTAMERRSQKWGDTIDKAFKGRSKAMEAFSAHFGVGGMGKLFAATAVGIGVMTAAVLKAADAAVEAKDKLDELAKAAGTSSEEAQKLSTVATAFGADWDKAMEQTNSSIKTFVSSGKGMTGYLDLIKDKVKRTQEDFVGLGAVDALRMINEDLDKVGATTEQRKAALQSLGSDVAALGPVLKMNRDEINGTFEDIAALQVTISNETAKIIKDMNKGFSTLGNNFGTLIVEKFRDIFRIAGKIADKLGGLLGDWAQSAKSENLLEDLRSGNSVDASGYQQSDLLAAEKKAIEEAEAEKAKIRERFARGREYGAGDNYEAEAKAIAKVDDATKTLLGSIQQLNREREQSIQNANDAELDTSARDKAAEDAAKKAAKFEQDKYNAKMKWITKTTDDQIFAEQHAHRLLMDELKKDLDDRLITEKEYNAAREALIEQSAKRIQDIRRAEAEKTRQIQVSFMTDDLAIQRSNNEAKKAEFERIAAEQGISEEVKNNKLAQIDREARSQELARDTQYWTDKNAAQLYQLGWEREQLKEQLDNKQITQDEFNRLSLENDRATSEAKKQLMLSELDAVSDLFDGMASSLEQGSKAQKAAFLVSKAGTIARLTMAGMEAWANVDKQPDVNLTFASANLTKGLIAAQYAAKIGAAAGTMIKGQAHSGIDSVPNSGTWNLEKGERVVGRALNQDLTDYLKSNENGSGQTTVNADLVIQGGSGDLDENKFNEYLIKHRESVTKAVTLARAENPNL